MRILIIDDHQLFLDGIAHILRKLDPAAAITESTGTEQAIGILESGEEFDLILIDLSMPGMDGMAILQRMHERKTSLPLVVVSSEENPRMIKSAMDFGALGFIPKTHGSQQMLAALNAVLDGEIYLPPEIQKHIDSLEARRIGGAANDEDPLRASGVTRRQYDVLKLMAQGYTNKQIAASLYLTEHTVKAHIGGLLNTLQARNRTECVQLAQRRGILAN